jgi:transposase
MQIRRNHTEEFREAAVRRWEEVRNFNQVGRELDISSSLVRRWKNQLDREGENAFPGKGHLSDKEMIPIKRENARLKEENTILIKAMGYFAVRPR